MTTWQVWLRRMCWVLLGWSFLLLGIAVVLFIVGTIAQVDNIDSIVLFDQTIEVHFFATMLSISSFAGAVLNAAVALLGIRGANNPPKITLFFWIVLIDAVLTAWSLASNFSRGIFDPMSILSGLFIITLATCAWQVRKQTGYFDNHPVKPSDEAAPNS